MLGRYIWLVATVSDNTDHFYVAESSIGLHCSKAFEICPGIVLCRAVDELMLPELASPSSPPRVVKWDIVLKLVLKFDSLAHQVLGIHWIFSLSSACSVGELAGLYWGTGAPAAPGQASTAQALH